MTAQYRILTGDSREWLAKLADNSVNCCVTSPPYFGLRDYGTATWEGGNAAHVHDTVGARGGRGGSGAPGKQTAGAFPDRVPVDICSCGAVRIDAQIGLEKSPAEYVQTLVELFREVRRVLRDDGTLWLNLGDSYAGSGKGGNPPDSEHQKQASNKGLISVVGYTAREAAKTKFAGEDRKYGLKSKDLIGIPWRVAFALQADGWYLRQDIIWAKPNPMPESVTDRCTKSHEYLFLLSKSPKYYFDAKAIAEPLARPEEANRKTPAKFGGADKFFEAKKQSRLHSGNEYVGTSTGTRNKRSVWVVSPKPFKEAHFATFPPALIAPCILAGCPENGVVLDPFGGAGTTALVANKLNRHAVLIELNPEYVEIANKRLAKELPPA